MKKTYIAAFAALAIVGSFSNQVLAQQAERQLIQVNQLVLKPNEAERFRAIHRDNFMPRGRASGLPFRVTTSAVLGQSFQVSVATPIPNFAALDGGTPLDGGTVEAQMLREAWNSAVTSRRSFVITSRPDMNMAPAPNADYSLVVRFQVKSGKAPQFEALWKSTIRPALVASGQKGTSVFQTLQGGRNGEYFALTPLANMAALDGPGPFSSMTPEEGARLTAQVSELLEEYETNITKTDHELSYGLPGLNP
jgi:hypothetical protein